MMNEALSEITIHIPNVIVNRYKQDMNALKDNLQIWAVIGSYLNGELSLSTCAEALGLGYRGFLDLLWSKGIQVDGLATHELDQQVDSLRTILNKHHPIS